MVGPQETVRFLAERIRKLETSMRAGAPATIPLGADGLSALFPGGQLSSGSLVELLPRVPGAGAWSLAMLMARYACGERKTLLIADTERCFYPPAASKFGIDPGRIIIIRPRTIREALLAVAQALRCPAIGAALGAFERLADRDGRRLQLAAESGGAIGVLLRPLLERSAPSFASVRLLMDPLPGGRRPTACAPGSASLSRRARRKNHGLGDRRCHGSCACIFPRGACSGAGSSGLSRRTGRWQSPGLSPTRDLK